jgi:opacity protein-like surface antigen
MKKKLISSTAIALLFSASAVFAGGPEMVIVGPSPFDGFYVGGFGSFQQTGFDIDGQTDFVKNKDNKTTTHTLATQSGGDTDSSGYYGVRGGWGKVFMNRWYGGVEGFAAFGNAKGSISTTVFPAEHSDHNSDHDSDHDSDRDSTTFTNSARVNTNWGVDARLGTLLSPTTLAYAILGAEWVNIKACVDGTADGGDTTFVNGCNSESKPGFLWGFGAEQMIWKNVSLFAQYTYVNPQKVTVNVSNNVHDDHGGDTVGDCDHDNKSSIRFSNTVKSEISAFTGGVNIRFGSNLF